MRVDTAGTLIFLLMGLRMHGILSEQSKEVKWKLAVGARAAVKNIDDALVA